MPEQPKVQETPAVNNEDPQSGAGAPEPAPAGENPPEPPVDPEAASSKLYEGIPEDHPIRTELESVRQESAARRILVRELEQTKEALTTQLSEAKTPEEFQAAVADYENKVAEATLTATKERVGRTHGLPDALVARLQGKNEEELTADAAALKALLPADQPAPTPPAPKDPPSGGLTPHQRATSAKEAAERIRQRAGNPLGA